MVYIRLDMSIDAVIHSAEKEYSTDKFGENKTYLGVRIHLGQRDSQVPAGQKSLLITNFPEHDNEWGLIGIEIWGGGSEILIGDKVWAERRGYGQIILIHKEVQ